MKKRKSEVSGALQVIFAVTDAIRELKSVPEGHLYGRMMPVMSLDQFNKIIKTAVGMGLVERRGLLLVWKEEGI